MSLATKEMVPVGEGRNARFDLICMVPLSAKAEKEAGRYCQSFSVSPERPAASKSVLSKIFPFLDTNETFVFSNPAENCGLLAFP